MLRKVVGKYFDLKNFAHARKLLLIEIEKAPNPRAYLMLAKACERMGLIEETRGYLEKSLSMDIPPQVRAEVEQMLKRL